MKRCLNPFRPPDQPGVFFGCGHCLPCKIKRRSLWSVRMLHELTTCRDTCFITLTYDERHLVRSASLITHAGTLMKHHLQSFFKRLRRRLVRDGLDGQLRYYACGEYGDGDGVLGVTQRPHYHAILFGVSQAYLKERINEIWHHGSRNDVSLVTEARIRYVAGYIDKKYFGDLGNRAYRDVEPPFQLFSKSLGLEFISRNYEQILYDGLLKVGKVGYSLPQSYKRRLSQHFPEAVEGLEIRRYENAKMYGLEWLLENFPQFGGRSYEELGSDERKVVADWIEADNSVYYADLIAGIKHKKSLNGENKI